MVSTERKRKVIIDVIYLIMIVAFIFLVIKYALGICLPFVSAFLVAIILQRPKNFIVRKTPLKKGLVSALLVLLSIAIIVTLIVLVGQSTMKDIKDFISYIGSLLADWKTYLENIKSWAIGLTDNLSEASKATAVAKINEIYNSILTKFAEAPAETANAAAAASEAAGNVAQSTADGSTGSVLSSITSSFSLSSLSGPLSGIVSTVSQIPSILITVIMSIVACCFMTSDYDKIKNFIKAQLPESKKKDLSRAKTLLKTSLGNMAKAYGLIMFITFMEITVGLYILKFLHIFDSNFIILIAIATAIVDIIPVLGTGTVVLPWALYSLITSNYKMAIGLFVMYVVITVIRQIIEPKLVAGQLGLSPVVTITSMYLGLKVFGVLGMLVTPLLIIMLKLLNDEGIIHLWESPKKALAEGEEEEKEEKKKAKPEKTQKPEKKKK